MENRLQLDKIFKRDFFNFIWNRLNYPLQYENILKKMRIAILESDQLWNSKYGSYIKHYEIEHNVLTVLLYFPGSNNLLTSQLKVLEVRSRKRTAEGMGENATWGNISVISSRVQDLTPTQVIQLSRSVE